ncbi:keratin, type II cytoskeletal 8-like [Acipenser oxyrinchus oxyrinchus]|uniref:Keratin, type II cytoskeletal 8-like n=1 Tax=Acipenser oxyrinchus oxyrinchus TaxID=40147 RepID=A0AAD8G6P5_ACIOX|nr:keratin, type II cytoskeletal 8-like [Acipenser oxyrinchus oxyrinchus]
MAYNRNSGARTFSSRSYSSPVNKMSVSRVNSAYFPGNRTGPSGISASWATPVSSAGILLSNPPNTEIDPRFHQIKTQEKEEIKGLNNKFADFINKVRHLEQQNKVLETKLKIMLEKGDYKSNIDQIVAVFGNNLASQRDRLSNDRDKLEKELARTKALVEDNKNKFEDEINRRTQLENEFVLSKKDVDEGYLQKVDLENTVESLMDELAFLKQLYDEEIRELQSQINNTAVTVEMDNNRGLDMKQIVEEVKMQYEGIAARGRDEAEQWYKNKVDDMAAEAEKYNQDLKGVKNEIAEMMRLIQRLNSEAEGLKNRRANLEMAIGEAEERGQLAVSDAKNRVSELEAALKSAKQAMAKQVHEYQDLMNLKLALEIEIATYRKLLEGEESRLGTHQQGGPRQDSQFSAIDQLDF